MWKNITYMIFIIACLSWGCKKEDPPKPTLLELMPERTEIGARKLAAIVNDDYIFENISLGIFDEHLNTTYLENLNGKLRLKAIYRYYGQNFQVIKETLQFQLFGVFVEGDYDLSTANAFFIKSGITYQEDSSNVGSLTITKLDTINGIVAGTFNLNLINYEQNETITVTNGWFDIQI